MKNENNYFSQKPNIKKNKKTYLISKLPENSPVRSEIKSSFEDVNKYLKVDRKIIIGSYIIIFRKSTVSISPAFRSDWYNPMEHSRSSLHVRRGRIDEIAKINFSQYKNEQQHHDIIEKRRKTQKSSVRINR